MSQAEQAPADMPACHEDEPAAAGKYSWTPPLTYANTSFKLIIVAHCLVKDVHVGEIICN